MRRKYDCKKNVQAIITGMNSIENFAQFMHTCFRPHEGTTNHHCNNLPKDLQPGHIVLQSWLLVESNAAFFALAPAPLQLQTMVCSNRCTLFLPRLPSSPPETFTLYKATSHSFYQEHTETVPSILLLKETAICPQQLQCIVYTLHIICAGAVI